MCMCTYMIQVVAMELLQSTAAGCCHLSKDIATLVSFCSGVVFPNSSCLLNVKQAIQHELSTQSRCPQHTSSPSSPITRIQP